MYDIGHAIALEGFENMSISNVHIAELMQESGVGFGTSGTRGLASDMYYGDSSVNSKCN